MFKESEDFKKVPLANLLYLANALEPIEMKRGEALDHTGYTYVIVSGKFKCQVG